MDHSWPILEPKIAAFKPTIQVIQVSLVARGLVSARGHARGHPGWCGAAVGGAQATEIPVMYCELKC